MEEELTRGARSQERGHVAPRFLRHRLGKGRSLLLDRFRAEIFSLRPIVEHLMIFSATAALLLQDKVVVKGVHPIRLVILRPVEAVVAYVPLRKVRARFRLLRTAAIPKKQRGPTSCVIFLQHTTRGLLVSSRLTFFELAHLDLICELKLSVAVPEGGRHVYTYLTIFYACITTPALRAIARSTPYDERCP